MSEKRNSKRNFKRGNGDNGRRGKPGGQRDSGGERQGSKSGYRVHDCADAVRNSANDPKWYSKFPQLLKDAGAISYSNINGVAYDNSVMNRALQESTNPIKVAQAGLMVIKLAPTFGISSDGASAVNMTARSTYAFMRKSNSGSANYVASDYMTYILAMSSLYAHHAEMVRLYGLFNVYSWNDRYLSKYVVEALGYEYESFVKNLASFRAYINTFATYLNRFNVPKEMSIYDRHAFLPLHLWKDAEQDKSQMYAFQFDYIYKWDGYRFETGSALVPTRIIGSGANGLITFDDLVTFSDELVTGMLVDSDISLMSGDTWKAWGENNLRTVVGITDGYSTIPMYDEVVLAQIHNVFVPGIIDPFGTRANYKDGQTEVGFNQFCIKQDENFNLIWDPYVMQDVVSTDAFSGLFPKQVLDSGFTNPTPEFNAEATRLKATLDAEQDPNENMYVDCYGWKLATCGTEIPTNISVYVLLSDEVGGGLVKIAGRASIEQGAFDVPTSTLLKFAPVFDWRPIIYSTYSQSFKGKFWSGYLINGELFNWCYIEDSTLKKLHEACLLSLLLTESMTTTV